jgi:hypothetical protein
MTVEPEIVRSAADMFQPRAEEPEKKEAEQEGGEESAPEAEEAEETGEEESSVEIDGASYSVDDVRVLTGIERDLAALSGDYVQDGVFTVDLGESGVYSGAEAVRQVASMGLTLVEMDRQFRTPEGATELLTRLVTQALETHGPKMEFQPIDLKALDPDMMSEEEKGLMGVIQGQFKREGQLMEMNRALTAELAEIKRDGMVLGPAEKEAKVVSEYLKETVTAAEVAEAKKATGEKDAKLAVMQYRLKSGSGKNPAGRPKREAQRGGAAPAGVDAPEQSREAKYRDMYGLSMKDSARLERQGFLHKPGSQKPTKAELGGSI